MKYRKKPIEIDAWKWEGITLRDARGFTAKYNLPTWNVGAYEGQSGLRINTLEGVMIARKGDYVIKGVKGEFYPCKPDIFKLTYEEVTNKQHGRNKRTP